MVVTVVVVALLVPEPPVVTRPLMAFKSEEILDFELGARVSFAPTLAVEVLAGGSEATSLVTAAPLAIAAAGVPLVEVVEVVVDDPAAVVLVVVVVVDGVAVDVDVAVDFTGVTDPVVAVVVVVVVPVVAAAAAVGAIGAEVTLALPAAVVGRIDRNSGGCCWCCCCKRMASRMYRT